MGTEQPPPEWDDQIDDLLVEIDVARRDRDKAQGDLAESRILHDRTERFERLALKRATEARIKLGEAQRKFANANRRAEDARRQGMSRQRWDLEARRWDTEAKNLVKSIRRLEDEARRKERDSKSMAEEVRNRTESVTQNLKVTHSLQQRLNYLQQTPLDRRQAPDVNGDHKSVDARASDVQSAPGSQASRAALSITVRAIGALKTALDATTHNSHQLLRLDLNSQGAVRLLLDSPKPTDRTVSHGGASVLLIDRSLLGRLSGRPLDARDSASGSQIVLT